MRTKTQALAAIAAIILLAGCTPARAQAPAPGVAAAQIPEANLAAARQLVDAMDAKQNSATIFRNMRGVLVNNLRSHVTGKSDEEIGKIVDDLLMPTIESHGTDFVELLARVQAQVYTLDELQQLTKLYESPLGRRMAANTPKIATLSLAAGQEWGRKVAIEAIQKNADELQKRGVKF